MGANEPLKKNVMYCQRA